ncbi:hypothetical protein [Pseudomonas sp. FG-3G]|nr:hypothetical protein [Pseudomonas sp. FG-3G]
MLLDRRYAGRLLFLSQLKRVTGLYRLPTLDLKGFFWSVRHWLENLLRASGLS